MARYVTKLSANALNLQKAALFVSKIYYSAISYKAKRLRANALNLVSGQSGSI